MIGIYDFKSENFEILALCQVNQVLIQDVNLRENPIVCELLDRFIDQVGAHLSHEDREVYHDLLEKHTPEAKQLANQFIENGRELKLILKSFKKDWCRKIHTADKHTNFLKDAEEVIELVKSRIRYEEEKIFPVFQK